MNKETDSKIILLSGKNANPNSQDDQGNTALHILAMRKGTPYTAEEAEKILVELSKSGANFNIKNKDGKIPLDLAMEHNSDSIIKVFTQHTLKEKEVNEQLKTKSQESTSSSSAAFFKAPTSSNESTYDVEEKNNMQRPRLN